MGYVVAVNNKSVKYIIKSTIRLYFLCSHTLRITSGDKSMMQRKNAPHKQLITTYPVAIKFGQGRVHLARLAEPWLGDAGTVRCPNPKCETVFTVTKEHNKGFPTDSLLERLEADHQNQKEHPDYIAFDSAMNITECDCDMVCATKPK
jgi:hypothetical protein